MKDMARYRSAIVTKSISVTSSLLQYDLKSRVTTPSSHHKTADTGWGTGVGRFVFREAGICIGPKPGGEEGGGPFGLAWPRLFGMRVVFGTPAPAPGGQKRKRFPPCPNRRVAHNKFHKGFDDGDGDASHHMPIKGDECGEDHSGPMGATVVAAWDPELLLRSTLMLWCCRFVRPVECPHDCKTDRKLQQGELPKVSFGSVKRLSPRFLKFRDPALLAVEPRCTVKSLIVPSMRMSLAVRESGCMVIRVKGFLDVMTRMVIMINSSPGFGRPDSCDAQHLIIIESTIL
nr:hypothetical protein CFP56_10046 [Quercus suber]